MKAKREASLVGPDERKLQPKLRVVANGSAEVNAVRAQFSSSVCLAPGSRYLDDEAPLFPPLVRRNQLPRGVSRGKLTQLAPDVLASIFIETADVSDEASRRLMLGQRARRGNLITAEIPVTELPAMLGDESVTWVEVGESLVVPPPMISAAGPAAPKTARRVAGQQHHHGGSGVLIGIIDVNGFDFAHPDFLDGNGDTRFVRIWDQGGDARPSPHEQEAAVFSTEFGYGSELRAEHLNAALAAAPAVHVAPQDIEPQSQMEPASHGTHVASIAAGNYGVCPQALIAGVLISLPPEDRARRRSFYDSTRIAHAVDYLTALATSMRVPLSINISLGTNGHAHDGSSAISRWIDSALSVPGRCVSVAAGNAGQEVAAFPGDLGFVMGRIHSARRLPARDLDTLLEWVVVGNGRVDISENELELWYSPQDRLAVSVRPPGGDWIGPVEPLQFIENQRLADGSFVSVYNELYHPANGANTISLYLSPFLNPAGVIGIPSGTWAVRLHAREVRDGRFHAWIERDDPRRLGRIGEREAWSFPSYFTQGSNVDSSSVSSLACGNSVIAVANLDEATERINITSSQGPTRDGRFKPDVAGPGTEIVAANGFGEPDEPWIAMTGTSMASPYVAGVAGLMLATEPGLTAAQIGGIIQRTARPLPGADFTWLTDAGFGRIDPVACVAEARIVNRRDDRTP